MTNYENLEKKIASAYTVPAPNPTTKNRDRQAILQLAEERTARPKHFWLPAWKPVLASLLVLTALVLAIGPNRVLAQLQTFFGFVPELGVVAPESTIMVLPEPLEFSQGRTTLRIDQAVLGPQSSVIRYYFTGVPEPKFIISLSPQQCTEKAWLQTPDGTRYFEANQGRGDFPALPAGTASIELRVPCIRNTLVGQANSDWRAPLTLAASAVEPTLLPVIAVDQYQPAELIPDPTASASSPQPEMEQVVSTVIDAIQVEKVIPSERGMILLLRSKAGKTVAAALQSSYFEAGKLNLWDADGKSIPYRVPENAEALISGLQTQTGSAYAIELRALPASGAIRIEQQAYPVRVASELSAQLTLENPGSKLNSPGQFWTSTLYRDDTIRFGAYALQLEYLQTSTDTEARLVFEQGPQILALKGTVVGASGPQASFEEYHEPGYRKIFLNFAYTSTSREDLHFTFTDPVVADPAQTLSGSWQPEPTLLASNPTPLAVQPCLAYDKPLDLTPAVSTFAQGKLLVTKAFVPDPQADPFQPTTWPPLYLYDMAGNELMQIEANAQEQASFSPNGQWVAFVQENGLAIKHLESGEKRTVTDQGLADMLWSPDSQMLAFQGGSSVRLYIYHLDTGAYDTLPFTRDMLVLDGWSQDGTQLYLSYLSSGGRKMVYDLQTATLADLQAPTMFALTSGGYSGQRDQWVYLTQGFSDLFLYDPATAETKFVAEGISTFAPAWKKDAWISLSLVDENLRSQEPFLLNVDSCEALSLPDLPGMRILDVYLP